MLPGTYITTTVIRLGQPWSAKGNKGYSTIVNAVNRDAYVLQYYRRLSGVTFAWVSPHTASFRITN